MSTANSLLSGGLEILAGVALRQREVNHLRVELEDSQMIMAQQA